MAMSGRVWTLASAVAATIALAAPAAAPAAAQEAVVLVRHAEKVDESKDPLLSRAGQARARALARHLRTAGVKAIYVTQYKRTQLTAAPLAAAARRTPIVLQADARRELADRIRRDHPRDVVVVVGHVDSVPDLLRLLGHAEPVTIAHSEYDNLFVLTPPAPEARRAFFACGTDVISRR